MRAPQPAAAAPAAAPVGADGVTIGMPLTAFPVGDVDPTIEVDCLNVDTWPDDHGGFYTRTELYRTEKSSLSAAMARGGEVRQPKQLGAAPDKPFSVKCLTLAMKNQPIPGGLDRLAQLASQNPTLRDSFTSLTQSTPFGAYAMGPALQLTAVGPLSVAGKARDTSFVFSGGKLAVIEVMVGAYQADDWAALMGDLDRRYGLIKPTAQDQADFDAGERPCLGGSTASGDVVLFRPRLAAGGIGVKLFYSASAAQAVAAGVPKECFPDAVASRLPDQ
ncbi:MAG: hypothetical protein ACHP84_19500 [Caulobacterales bacterium]